MKATLWTDGGARGNPGPAAYGYVLEAEDGTVLAAHGEAIGTATNNVAEYRALIAGLEKAVELAVDELEVVSDSELLVKQMRRRVQGQERDPPRASRRGVRPGASARLGAIQGGPARAQRARRPSRQRGPGRRRRLEKPRLYSTEFADVAQLARASACHAEGRGFESHHPLSKVPANEQVQSSPLVNGTEPRGKVRCRLQKVMRGATRRVVGRWSDFPSEAVAGRDRTSGVGDAEARPKGTSRRCVLRGAAKPSRSVGWLVSR